MISAAMQIKPSVGCCTCCRWKASNNAAMCEALLAAGAVLVGKANTVEVGIGTTGLNLLHGTPRNPHDPQRFTGGSSSGSAAIVASGLCPIAVGESWAPAGNHSVDPRSNMTDLMLTAGALPC